MICKSIESVFNALYIEIKEHFFKKNFFGQNNQYKKFPPFSFAISDRCSVLLLICDSYLSWNARIISLKLRVRFSIFDSVSFLLKFELLLKKCMDSLTLTRHNSIQNQNNRKATHSVAHTDLWILSCNKKFQNSMISAWNGSPQKLTWWKIFQTYKIEVLRTSDFLSNNFQVNIWHSFT